jgi:hypothetical protein
MLIIVDKKIPAAAKIHLQKFGKLMELETSGITYPAISGHPDIFFTQIDNQLIVAPNLPDIFKKQLQESEIDFMIGHQPVGSVYPETARYNAVVTSNYFIHHPHISDQEVKNYCGDKIHLPVKQGYTRCNLIFIHENAAITSDEGIAKKLQAANVETLFVRPQGIQLPGFDHGFFGGCCGMWANQLFILGNLSHFSEGEKVRRFTVKHGLEIVELCDAPLFDGGGIFFAESNVG